jgi:GNAT superfamily N-acetyltransferase
MDADIRYELMTELPDDLLKAWSEVTQDKKETHLTPETPESLRIGVLAAVVAFVGDEAVGFAGLITARTGAGHGLCWRGRKVVELGGVWVHPDWREHGIWTQMLRRRIRFGSSQNWHVVCVTTNDVVKRGMRKPRMRKLGAKLIQDSELKAALCIGCANAATCGFCPMRTAECWEVV